MRAHEPGLYHHSMRVGTLANDFYRFSGMEYGQGWILVEGALLHDLGKVCLPLSLLNKPKGLNDAEKRMVALHPTIGAELLKAQGYFGGPVINIVKRHHERLDGSGYPDGWRKQRTAKVVRTVAVCDALCAMTEQRPYEDAWPLTEALERLKSMPDQYDQEPVGLLDMMIRKGATNMHKDGRPATQIDSSRKSSGVLRPRSAFYAPRSRFGIRLIH